MSSILLEIFLELIKLAVKPFARKNFTRELLTVHEMLKTLFKKLIVLLYDENFRKIIF